MKSILNPHDRDALLRRIALLTPDAKRRWGRMSPGGMVCHLNDAFELVLGDRVSRARPPRIPKALIRFVAFTSPLPWPKGAKTAPEADQEQGGTPPGVFSEDLAKLRGLIDRFIADLEQGRLGPHPFFGVMSRGEWARWAFRHTDHHLRQFGI